jgi:4-methyl-5(b-hydroxyethyl)-thiazole monophosphate biosynthesis
MRTAVVILADGFEEIEAVTPIDVLRRAGVDVTTVGLTAPTVTGAHGIEIAVDRALDALAVEPDLVVLPGGLPGATNLGASQAVVDLLRRQHAAGRMIAAICAAPAFAPVEAGILDGRRATCYPSFESRFPKTVTAVDDRVVIDGNLVTSRGPGTALDMALTLVELLVGAAEATKLRAGMLAE